MNRTTFIRHYNLAAYREESVKGTLYSLYILVTTIKDKKKLSVLDNILKDYVTSYENEYHYHGSCYEKTGKYTVICYKMPKVIAKKLIAAVAAILKAKQVAEEKQEDENELKDKKTKTYYDELCK